MPPISGRAIDPAPVDPAPVDPDPRLVPSGAIHSVIIATAAPEEGKAYGYVDHHALGRPGPALFRHFLEHMGGLASVVYGRRTYEIMQYWDEEQPD
jgi:hypothetical protein